MSDGNRTWARVPHDMGANRIEHLGRSTVADGAARIDDTWKVKTDSPDTNADYLDAKLVDQNGDAFPVAVVGGVRKVVVTPGDSPDRKVASGATDTTPDVLINKVESLDGSITITEDTAGRRVNFQTTPATKEGGKLYTAYVPDLLLHPSVDAHFSSTSSCGGEMFLGYWTEIATGVWRKNDPGLVSSNFTDDVEVFQGMRLFAWLGPIEAQNSGIYVLTDTGEDPITHAPTYAQMQRADDMKTSAQIKSGAYFTITGGTAWGGHTFELTTPDPIELNVTALSWSDVSPAPTASPTYELLIAAQFSLAGPDTNQATAFAKSTSGLVELQTFTEHDTALGGQTIPAGATIRFHDRVSLWADDPAATSVINHYLRAHAPGGTEPWQFVCSTGPLHNPTPGDWIAAGSLGADYPIPIGSVLEADYRFESDSVDGVNVNFVYNNAAHSTYIELPLTIGFAGTDDHQQLIDRGAFLVAGNDRKYGHPQSFIEPGRVHSPTGPTIYLVDGVLTMPQSNTARVGAVEGDHFCGISIDASGPDPWQKGDEVALWFDSGCDIQGSVSVPDGVGMLQLGGQFIDPSNPSAGQRLFVTAFSCLHFIYDGGVNWFLSTPPVVQ